MTRSFVVPLFAFTLASCGTGTGSDSNDLGPNPAPVPTTTPNVGSKQKPYSLAATSTNELPKCEKGMEGALAYTTGDKTFHACADGSWIKIETKGEPGVAGPKGMDGAPAASSKIVATIRFGGDLSTLSAAARTRNGQTVPASIWVRYNSATMTNGDTFATAEVVDESFAVTSTRFYSAGQNGAADASVLVAADAVGPSNAGYWQVSVNRSTGVATVRYTDGDLGSPDYLEWQFQPSACTIQTW